MFLRSPPMRSLTLLFIASLAACDDDPAAPDHDTGAPDTTDTIGTTGEPDAQPDATPDGNAEIDEPFRPIDLAVVPPPGAVIAGVAEEPAHLVRGPKAEGQLGDFVLANHEARFLVEAVRPAGGYRQFGGNLVDADLQPGGEDRFSELWLIWNLRAFSPDRIEVVSDGRDGLAIVRATGRTTRYAWVDAILGDLLIADPIDLQTTYEYRLAPDSRVLELIVTFVNDQAEPADVRLPLVALNMGDGAPAFTPGPGLASIGSGTPWTWTGGVGLARAYGFFPPPGVTPIALFQETNVQISQLPRFQLEPGQSQALTFRVVVADDGTTSIEEARAALADEPLATLSGRVLGETPWAEDDGEDLPSHTGGRSWVAVTREAAVIALTPVRPDGTWRAVVPPGDVQVQAHAPGRGASEPALLTATATHALDLELPALGEVTVRVRDPDGAHVPAQVTFFRVDAPSPFSPEAVRFEPDWGRGRSLVAFQTGSQIVAHLLPGSYRIVASRGYSYELAEAPLEVAPGAGDPSQLVELTIEKVVDDAGWSAADLHLHALWSPDSEVPYPVRLRQAAANDVALPVFTEHTYMGPLDEARAAAGVDAWVTPIPGQEVSTVEYGHFGAFPLVYDPAAPSGGAVFEHGWEGTALFDTIREQHDGDVIVQVNHPRVSTRISAYFTAIDLDSQTGVAATPERWTSGWDTLEVFNDGCGGGGGNAQALEDWMNLNDLGLKKTLSSGSDSHSEAAGLGHPRSWIEVERDLVELDDEAIVAPLRARRSFVSCGPFVRFSAADGTPMGGLGALAADGAARFFVQVEAPSWMQVDRVHLLENGVIVDEVALDDWPRPADLRPAVRFMGELSATPRADAWYVIEVIGSDGLWPIEPGEDPYAMTNPIDIDADGDGAWTPPAQTRTTRPDTRRRLPSPAGHEHGHHHHHHHE